VALAIASCAPAPSGTGAAARRALQPVGAPPATTTTAPAGRVDCHHPPAGYDPRATLRPARALPQPGRMPVGTYMHTIQQQGSLRVGVDQNTDGFAARDPSTGEIAGFDVDLAHEISRAILGDPNRVVLVPVLTDDKIDAVQRRTVDITVDAITITCDRANNVDFSAEYYTAQQQLLARNDRAAAVQRDLSGRRICVAKGSSSGAILRQVDAELTASGRRGVSIVEVDARTDCLIAIQEGEVDAYFGHDTFLYGMRKQDPTTSIVPAPLPRATTESHYGIAITPGKPEFVRFVNGVLEQLPRTKQWDDMRAGLQKTLGLKLADPPPPVYRSES
jgi:polar amino acid transport system substrate-binding protein